LPMISELEDGMSFNERKIANIIYETPPKRKIKAHNLKCTDKLR
jgi:hypothetical protein